jgi:hypothetical protein
MTEDVPTVMFVRLRRGVVGETLRLVHIVPILDPDAIPPHVLTAYCGLDIHPGTAELLPEPKGMPCVHCLATVPLPGQEEQLTEGPSRAIQASTEDRTSWRTPGSTTNPKQN